MNYKADNVKIHIDELLRTHPREAVIRKLRLDETLVKDFTLTRLSLDSRFHKSLGIFHVFQATFSYPKKINHPCVKQHQKKPIDFTAAFAARKQSEPTVIVGSGPAGLFAALRLADYGIRSVIIEKGEDIPKRTEDIKEFFENRSLCVNSNVQFGLGGAGTYSDGKLMSRSKSKMNRYVLERLIEFGADPAILYQAKPHLGTDKLRRIVVAIKEYLQRNGCEFKFGCEMTQIITHNAHIASIIINEKEELACAELILAPGNASRSTFEMLKAQGVAMAAKPFAVGVRAEHPQSVINRYMFGKYDTHPVLQSAEYQLTYHDGESGRSVYSFCNCPGGLVINSATEAGGIATNGMSYSGRGMSGANAALVVSVSQSDFDSDSALAGMYFQRKLEQDAFKLTGSNYDAPVMSIRDFLGRGGSGSVKPAIRPGYAYADINECLPDFIAASLKNALQAFCARIDGFSQGILTAAETRTSSPVRIIRNAETLESVNTKDLFPAGEGAGYAGGIMSSAVDGVRIAENISSKYKN